MAIDDAVQFRRLTRREVLGGLSATLLAGGCSRPKTRAEVVHELSLDVSVSDLAAIHAATDRLVESFEASARSAGTNELMAVRARFRDALLAWERASCFPNMALTNSHAELRALYWPIRVGAVQNLLLGTQTVDEHHVTDLGVDRKGLFAIEFLLFGAPGKNDRPLVETPGRMGARARSLGLAFARNIAACAKSARDFEAEPEVDSNTLLTRVVSQMTTTLGSIASGRLSKGLDAARAERPSEVRGYASGTSFGILSALVAGTERVYLGSSGVGLATLVAQTAPDCDKHLRELFQTAKSELARAGHSSATAPVFAAARKAVRSLDTAVETELATALGITLLFTGNDAD